MLLSMALFFLPKLSAKDIAKRQSKTTVFQTLYPDKKGHALKHDLFKQSKIFTGKTWPKPDRPNSLYTVPALSEAS